MQTHNLTAKPCKAVPTGFGKTSYNPGNPGVFYCFHSLPDGEITP